MISIDYSGTKKDTYDLYVNTCSCESVGLQRVWPTNSNGTKWRTLNFVRITNTVFGLPDTVAE